MLKSILRRRVSVPGMREEDGVNATRTTYLCLKGSLEQLGPLRHNGAPFLKLPGIRSGSTR
jgi:hypothetical protein